MLRSFLLLLAGLIVIGSNVFAVDAQTCREAECSAYCSADNMNIRACFKYSEHMATNLGSKGFFYKLSKNMNLPSGWMGSPVGFGNNEPIAAPVYEASAYIAVLDQICKAQVMDQKDNDDHTRACYNLASRLLLLYSDKPRSDEARNHLNTIGVVLTNICNENVVKGKPLCVMPKAANILTVEEQQLLGSATQRTYCAKERIYVPSIPVAPIMGQMPGSDNSARAEVTYLPSAEILYPEGDDYYLVFDKPTVVSVDGRKYGLGMGPEGRLIVKAGEVLPLKGGPHVVTYYRMNDNNCEVKIAIR
jgi:hypothetical protein